MQQYFAFALSALLLTGTFITGCSKGTGPDDGQPPPGVTNEIEAMKYYAQNDEFVVNDEETFGDKEIAPLEYGTFGKVDAAVTPLRIGRVIQQVTRTVDLTVLPGDTLASAVVEKNILGTLKIRALNGNGDSVTIEKPFNDKSKRIVTFKRTARERKQYWRNWKPVATSLVVGETVAPNNLITITKLEFAKPDGKTVTITEPNAHFMRYRWLLLYAGGQTDVPEFSGGHQVKLSVTLISTSPDSDLVALRYGFSGVSRKRVKLIMTSELKNTDGTYTRVYETSRNVPLFMHFNRGFFHMGVDAMTRATVFDDTAPYSASWWGVPYRVF